MISERSVLSQQILLLITERYVVEFLQIVGGEGRKETLAVAPSHPLPPKLYKYSTQWAIFEAL